VVHPCDAASLRGALEAGHKGLIVPVLIGPQQKIQAVAAEAGLSLQDVELLDVPYSHAAAARAVQLAASGAVEMLMKGSLHTDELISAVLAEPALRTKSRLSHVFRLEVPMYDKVLLISDGALHPARPQ
jgi:phosphate acetyltransferase